MPRIDPLSLLKCLSVLLGSTGGIKSKEEVHRLANLMTKFSKKLVSKCIYIQILKTTDTDLLSQFMGAGGWNLVHMWLTDGILAKNWALIQELLELLLLCPVDIERLKSNNCPKLIKGLSKEGSHQGVRILASRLVEQWLKIVKGEAAPNSVPAQIVTVSGSIKPCPIPTAIVHPRPSSVISTTQIISSSCSSSSSSNNSSSSLSEKNETDKNTQLAQSNCCLVVDDAQENQQIESSNESHYHRISEKTLQLPTDVNTKLIQQQTQCQQQKKQSFVVVPTSQTSMGVPVYKITIRDGKQVLTKVETDTGNISNAINLPTSEINGELTNDALEFQNAREAQIIDKGCQKVENQIRVTDKGDGKVKESDLPSNQNSGEITSVVSSKDSCESDNVDVKIKDNKDVKHPAISSDSNKSANDKENRDSSKKDIDKKNYSNNNNNSSSSSNIASTTISSSGIGTTSDKKSSHHGSSSSSGKSSSKHSSSHRSSSNSHRSSSTSSSSSSHRTNSKSTTSKDKKDKDKHHSSSSSSSKHSSNSKSRSERDKEKEKEKEKLKKDQAEKDKATLEKVQGPALTSKLGKIPKKKTDDEKPNDIASKRSSTDSKESKDKDTKKPLPVSTEQKKNISISIENRKALETTRPKTVKTFNSKFRSTGLEEEAKPPPPRSARKPNLVADKQKILSSKVSSLKRSSPLRESSSSADKKARLLLDNSVTPPNDEKKGGIKLIPPKPKPMILQESDMFMDALTAASTKNKEPRKRKRRTSISKEGSGGPEVKKLESGNNSENNQDHSPPMTSPTATSTTSQKTEDKALLKPNLKFYQDTLEIDDDKEETKGKSKSEGVNSKAKTENGEEEAEEERDEDDDDEDDEEDDDEEHKTKIIKEGNQDEEEDDEERSTTPTPAEDSFGEKALESNQEIVESPNKDIRYVDGLRSVLLLQKRKGPKKTLKWKVELESIRYFELDETERVNVTKTFTDMKQMEKQTEREGFQLARKLSNEDLMEEKTRWRALIPIDIPPALVEPGKDSREKDIQYAREKGILQALYFHRSMIPDSPAEPEEERLLPVIEAKAIPLDDLTGTKANEKDFTAIPWPEPKPQLPNPQTPPVTMTNFPYQAYPPNNQHPMIPTMGPPQQAPMGPMPPMPQPMMNPMNQMGAEMVGVPVPPGGGWRTGDGKVVVPDMPGMNPMSNVPGGGYPPQGIEGQMVPPPPGMMGPPIYNQPDGFMLGPDEMGYNNVPNNFPGPPGPVMFGPGPGPGPNFQGGPRGGGPGPMHVNRGRGGPPGAGWFRGGPPPRGVGWRGGWRGNAKQPPICRQFSKSGYCRAENKCQFLHPGVNCPPF